jgi:hypothetical protein
MGELTHSLYFIFTAVKLFGIQPTLKKRHLAYNCVLLLTVIVSNLIRIKSKINKIKDGNDDSELITQKVVSILSSTVIIANNISFILFVIYQTKNFKTIINTLELQCSVLNCNSEFYRKTRIKFIYYFIILIFSVLFLFIFQCVIWRNSFKKMLFSFLETYFDYLINITLETQFLCILHTQGRLFQLISQEIQVKKQKKVYQK